jgi:putative nucleotidyltransferase with HDIG domain
MFSMSDVFTARNDLADIIDIRNSKLNSINNHNLRVSELSVNLAKAINMSSEDINQILIGSYLHDIGKIFLGNELLEGDKPLSVRQKNEIIRHTVLGHGYLKSVSGLDKAKEIILLHHEKIDGTGYPHGLVGSEIPIHVRIVSICDSYDAMTSYRAYRPIKLTHEEAVQELIKNKGTQFDSMLVDVFITQLDSSYSNN